ncbi:hypothetical protein HPP92_028216 [Vanilla planifolia]|uniref:Uncharacterized protein n=1 Tax=Vanilla planifolia TaxID=51239 RepID=A0A835P9I8_VANPL|nr:hypothetical protein HPP92_028216 [Vanilla planifolia]
MMLLLGKDAIKVTANNHLRSLTKDILKKLKEGTPNLMSIVSINRRDKPRLAIGMGNLNRDYLFGHMKKLNKDKVGVPMDNALVKESNHMRKKINKAWGNIFLPSYGGDSSLALPNDGKDHEHGKVRGDALHDGRQYVLLPLVSNIRSGFPHNKIVHSLIVRMIDNKGLCSPHFSPSSLSINRTTSNIAQQEEEERKKGKEEVVGVGCEKSYTIEIAEFDAAAELISAAATRRSLLAIITYRMDIYNRKANPYMTLSKR